MFTHKKCSLTHFCSIVHQESDKDKFQQSLDSSCKGLLAQSPIPRIMHCSSLDSSGHKKSSIIHSIIHTAVASVTLSAGCVDNLVHLFRDTEKSRLSNSLGAIGNHVSLGLNQFILNDENCRTYVNQQKKLLFRPFLIAHTAYEKKTRIRFQIRKITCFLVYNHEFPRIGRGTS